MSNNLFPIAKEAWIYIAFSFLAFILFSIFDLEVLSILSLFVGMFFAFLFRNPERELPIFEINSVLSPVDGRLISIEECDDLQYRYKLSIDSSYLDVATLRVPMNARVKSSLMKHGTALNIESDLAKKINENVNIVFEDAQKNTLKISHILKQSFCGIRLNNIKTKSFLQSARYGTMLNGITYIYIPQNFRLNVVVGDKLEASKSLIGYFS